MGNFIHQWEFFHEILSLSLSISLFSSFPPSLLPPLLASFVYFLLCVWPLVACCAYLHIAKSSLKTLPQHSSSTRFHTCECSYCSSQTKKKKSKFQTIYRRADHKNSDWAINRVAGSNPPGAGGHTHCQHISFYESVIKALFYGSLGQL